MNSQTLEEVARLEKVIAFCLIGWASWNWMYFCNDVTSQHDANIALANFE